jgi:hypothetical protein
MEKMDQSALRLKVELRIEPGRSEFYILGRQIEVEDVGSHFWYTLETPRRILPTDEAFSLQRLERGL